MAVARARLKFIIAALFQFKRVHSRFVGRHRTGMRWGASEWSPCSESLVRPTSCPYAIHPQLQIQPFPLQ